MKYYGTKLLLLHNYMSPNFSDEATDRKNIEIHTKLYGMIKE